MSLICGLAVVVYHAMKTDGRWDPEVLELETRTDKQSVGRPPRWADGQMIRRYQKSRWEPLETPYKIYRYVPQLEISIG
ncbi:jg17579 [Pararge aegeria aegeria]|uniref:Jg17579 protein n=1 Tax=Pararge aegeria aegeria TaxID=348720 RepID=A0A8S4RPM3_9NEOP|nr:jg17579 [Pararge aegeria aegeria]